MLQLSCDTVDGGWCWCLVSWCCLRPNPVFTNLFPNWVWPLCLQQCHTSDLIVSFMIIHYCSISENVFLHNQLKPCMMINMLLEQGPNHCWSSRVPQVEVLISLVCTFTIEILFLDVIAHLTPLHIHQPSVPSTMAGILQGMILVPKSCQFWMPTWKVGVILFYLMSFDVDCNIRLVSNMLW